MMFKVLVYGYATGVFSSRKIARRLHEDVAFRVQASGNFPKHCTPCDSELPAKGQVGHRETGLPRRLTGLEPQPPQETRIDRQHSASETRGEGWAVLRVEPAKVLETSG